MNQANTKIAFQHRLDESFHKHPHHIAIESSDNHITYSQLESQANSICQWITNEDISPESFIGICFDHSIDIIPVMIGILKARCVFVILDTALPRQRLLNMIRLTHLQIIFISAQDQKMLFDCGDEVNQPGAEKPIKVIVVDEAFYRNSRVSSLSDQYPGAREYNREDKIYIYFTSGTTGMPRALVGKNKSLLHFIDWEIETFGIDQTFRFSQWITPGFDAFLRDVFTPLCAGAVICIPPHRVLEMAGHELILWLNARHIGLIHCVPSIFRLVNTFTEKSIAKENFKALKMVVMSGEKIIPHDLTLWFDAFDERIQLINLYGSSETTMCKTGYFLSPADSHRPIVPVGKPIPGARVLILDEKMRLCPRKFVGEIYIRTPFRTHGYYNDPKANKEKFIPNPFSKDPDDWLHKTGDWGRLLSDDNIEVLGRTDRQVKIRGVRVEPEEIENILLQHPDVAEIAIINKENHAGETYLCAYFVPRRAHPDPGSLELTATPKTVDSTEVIVPLEDKITGELREYLAVNLPPYMIPSFFIPLEKMPLTANGKINRRALPDPQLKEIHYIPPANDTEEKLTGIWSQVLNVDKDKISMDANFFRIGGHSLNAVILVSKIHRQLAIQIPLAEIFRSPSIRSLSQYINGAALSENRLLSIEPAETKEYYPLSSAQKRLYFLQQLDPQNIAYNMPMVQPLENAIDGQELESILKKLIARHETLRTSFIQVGNEPFQKVHDHVSFEIEYFDLSADLDGKNRQTQIFLATKGTEDTESTESVTDKIHHFIQSFVRPFDLSKAPLLRSGLIRMPNGHYIWLVDIHHIVTDGTSQIILTEDFFTFTQGRELAPLPLQYKDFSQWQNCLLESRVIKSQQEYWLSMLAGEIPHLDLPLDYKRPDRFTFAGSNYSFILDREDTLKFRELGNQAGATLYMNILAILNVLFYKYTGQTDIIIGSGIAGRLHEDLQGIVGMFVNSLPMRNHPNSEKTYEYFLNEVTANSIKSFENQDVQFEDLVEKLDITRDLSRNPAFDILMVVQNFREATAIKENLKSERTVENPLQIDYKRPTSKFDLTFFVNEMADHIYIIIEYYTGIFKEETIQRLASHFKAIIKNIITIPSIKLKHINILSEDEKQQIIQEFNDTKRDYPGDKPIPQLFVEQVEKSPDSIALVGACEKEAKKRRREEEKENCVETLRATSLQYKYQLTYSQLNEQSNRMAGLLIEKGVLADTIVGIMGNRSSETITGVLGIIKAGGTYLPIDPGYPRERINYILNDSGATLLAVANNKEGEKVRWWEGEKNFEIVFLDLVCSSSFPTSYLPNFLTSHPFGLAYIIYTSGSTGRPKGVMVEHRNVVRLVKNTDYIDFQPGDRLLQTGALEFDASTFEIWGSLLNGLTLYLESKENILNPGKLKNIITNNHITIMWLTSQLFNRLVQADMDIFAGLWHLLVGGDVLSPFHIEQARRKFPGLRIINGYGPTENTTFSTTFVIEKEYKEKIPIGKPIANSSAYIVDSTGELQPKGVTGEIWVGGDGVSRGYLNNPELTWGKFKFNNFNRSYRTHRTYIIFYKTGDLGRWLPDGNIEFLGRIDQQVKIRGFRIELEEIENRLAGHKNVQDVVVVAWEGEDSDKYLCAYIVPMETAAFREAELREYLAVQLPGYMMPAYWVALEKMPLTANGKIDHNALPEPGFNRDNIFVSPANETERKLAAIWSDILAIDKEKISTHDNFFRLGGHSLKATTLVAKIHKELNMKIPLAEIFRIPTIRELAEHINGLSQDIYVSIEPIEKKEYYPLSSAQERMYFLQQFDLKSIGYNIPLIVPLGKEIGKDKLELTLRQLIDRHESLRTSFERINEQVVQRIHEKVEFKIEYFNLATLSTDYTDSTDSTDSTDGRGAPLWSPGIIKNFIRPFDLSQAPLIRSGLIEKLDGTYTWIVDMHHIISDGTSHAILTEDFTTLYSGKELKPLHIQYKDFASWQHCRRETGKIRAQMSYWLDLLAGEIPRLNLPADQKRPTVFTFKGNKYGFLLTGEEVKKFKELGLQGGGTLYMNMLAALNILFYKYTGQSDIIIGSGIAGRRHADLQGIVGMFINTLVMRNYPDGEKTYENFLNEVIAGSIKGFENQDVQFEDLVDNLDLDRDASRNPVFDIMMTVQNFRSPGAAKEKEREKGNPKVDEEIVPGEYNEYNIPISKFDMTFFLNEQGDDIFINIEYYTAIFKTETIQRMGFHFQNIIKKVSIDPSIKLKDIEIISDDEKKKVIYEFNDTKKDYPKDKTIHQLFAEQSAKTPDHISVIEDLAVETLRATSLQYKYQYQYQHQHQHQYQITYRQLNEQSDLLAGSLIKKGALPGEIIGIMMERSIELINGIVGILKTGCAYMPINPGNPPDRIDYMLKDSNAKMLVTTNDKEGEKVRRWEGETNLAYIIYTSGSTGNPKGVPITHANICPLLHWGYKLGIGHKDRTLQNLSYYFDWSVWEIFITLTTGAGLYMISNELVLNPRECIPFLKKNNITILHATPTQYQHLISGGHKLETLKYLFLGAEKLTANLLKHSLVSVRNECRVFNMYGPTEATIISAVLEIERNDAHKFVELSSVPIGKPVANANLLILNKDVNLCPVNITGELYIGGPGIANGYLNNPELTCEKFKFNNFNRSYRTHRTYINFYKTGDLARWLPDGNIEFLGRIDHQVKIRGFRIELGEIENQLATHAQVKEAVTLIKTDESGENYLCAYIVLKKELEPVELKEYLAGRLPGYMIPSFFTFLEKIPLTPNGKLDWKNLPEPGRQDTSLYVAPINEIETKLVKIWSEILHMDPEKISTHDNFFNVGGHSLKTITLTSLIHKEFKVKMSQSVVFLNPTVKGLAQYISQSVKTLYDTIKPVEKKEYYVLSPNQKRLYILQQVAPLSTAYNMPQTIPLPINFDIKRLNQIFLQLIQRHEGLRTSFQTVNDVPMQKVHEPGEMTFNIDRLGKRSQGADRGAPPWSPDIMMNFVHSFDLACAPLLRVGLVKNIDESYILLVDMHHIVSDAASQDILVKDFLHLYQNNGTAEPLNETLPLLRIQYKDFAEWQNSKGQIENIKQQEAYWLKEFEDKIPPLKLPYDFPRPQVHSFQGDAVNFSFEKQLVRSLGIIVSRQEVTMYMMFLALLNVLLAKLCGQEDIVIGTASAGRGHADLQEIIGMFVNTLALRNYPQHQKTFSEFLQEIKQRTLTAFENQDYPFEDLVDNVVPYRNIDRNPLFDIMFNFLESDKEKLEKETNNDNNENNNDNKFEHQLNASKFDMTFIISKIGADELYFNIRYSTQLFKKETIHTVIHSFKEIISSVVANPTGKISEIKITTQSKMDNLETDTCADLENE